MDANEKTPRAVCEAKLTDELLREGYEKLFGSILRGKWRFIVTVPLVIVIGALALVRHDPVLTLLAAILAAYAIGRFLLIIRTKKSIGKTVDRIRSLYGDVMRLEFSEDSVCVRTASAAETYRYDSVFRAVETERLWLLYLGDTKASQVLFVPKPAEADDPGYGSFLDRILDGLPETAVKRLK